MQVEMKRKLRQQYLNQTKYTLNKDTNQKQRRKLYNDRGLIQEDTTIVNIYAPNIGAPKYIKQH